MMAQSEEDGIYPVHVAFRRTLEVTHTWCLLLIPKRIVPRASSMLRGSS